MNNGEINKNGFTVIEVVLVLAIAGLIFILVFAALPALQRSQRDNDRRDAMMSFVNRVKQFQTNNRGSLPGAKSDYPFIVTVNDGVASDGKGDDNSSTSWVGFYNDYLGAKFLDPEGPNYQLYVTQCYSDKASEGESCSYGDIQTELKKVRDGDFPYSGSGDYPFSLLVVTKAKCNGSDIVASNNPRNIAVTYRLEGAGSFCESS